MRTLPTAVVNAPPAVNAVIVGFVWRPARKVPSAALKTQQEISNMWWPPTVASGAGFAPGHVHAGFGI